MSVSPVGREAGGGVTAAIVRRRRRAQPHWIMAGTCDAGSEQLASAQRARSDARQRTAGFFMDIVHPSLWSRANSAGDGTRGSSRFSNTLPQELPGGAIRLSAIRGGRRCPGVLAAPHSRALSRTGNR